MKTFHDFNEKENAMDCQQLFGEFLDEYPEYNECVRYQDGVPVVGWNGLEAFLAWIQRHQSANGIEFFPW